MSSASSRGSNALALLPNYLVDAGGIEFYDERAAPEGCLQVSIAENHCVAPMMVEKVNDVQRNSVFTPDMIYYQNTYGMAGCRESMAGFMSTIMGTPSQIDPEQLVIGAGCNAVLENLFVALCEPGDEVLLPSPYYATFSFDLGCRAGVKLRETEREWSEVELEGVALTRAETYYPQIEDLELAYQRGEKKPKVLLLTNPHNPLGICMPKSVLDGLVEWAMGKGMHVVSDEIYAGSIHGQGFYSLAGEASKNQNVHVVYALSKDLGASGLRVGALLSSNEEVLAPVRKLNDLCQVSSTTQQLVEKMLGDKEWVAGFLKENMRLVRRRYKRVLEACNEAGIKYLECDGGLYVWLDLRPWMREGETEKDLGSRLIKEHGLLMTPGESMDMRCDGFFRLVFTAVGDAEFELVLERLRGLE
ncbi:hypothetical protein TrVE_jg3837 [Triparma verrucosa]|uniref:Aminotransferase class I/classII large domain-containing protein n=1 Tax=Triparma verrucosa TaxID=1606542 RepID=A0A9W7C3N5_9STRA|nr:hypothetical protein TrVE_jg3837 [Triparma verrucosa]